MVNLLVILILLFSLPSWAAYNPSGLDTITVAGRVLPPINSAGKPRIHLKGSVASGNSTSTLILAEKVTTGGYTPSGALSFRVAAVKMNVITSVANTGTAFGYANSDVGFRSNATPTSPVQLGGLSASTQFQFSIGATGQSEYLSGMLVPNGKFLWIGNSASTTGEYVVDVFGYEE